MNERIEKLANEAWCSVNQRIGFNDAQRRELFEQKFAELIVQECATAIIKDSRLNDVRSAANGCVRTIKEHFGVEE